jgi:hypothetical protein
VNENYKDRAVQVMVACGPFTVKNSLSYQGLIDFLAIARKEQPQAVILMGPFVDFNNQDISTGDIFIQHPDQTRTYFTHEQIFKDLLSTI